MKASTSALAAVHERARLGEAGCELVADLIPRGGDGVGVGLGEDGSEQRGGHVLVAAGHHREQVPDEVHPAALVGRSLEPAVSGCAEPSVRV